MVTFLILRHGYSEGNKEKRFSGQLDVPLDAVGLSQAQSIKDYIVKSYAVDGIYSSDLRRAVETARPLAEALGLPLMLEKDLREVDVGAWQGRGIQEVKAQYPAEFEAYRTSPGTFRFPEGEGYTDVMRRASSVLARLAAKNEGKTLVIATHGGVVRNLRAVWGGVSPARVGEIPHVPNASLTVAVYDGERVTLPLVGYADYLTDKTTEEGIK